MRKIIVGSRKSKLALTQTNWFIDQLKALGLPYEFEVKEIVTKGDVILDVTLSKVGGKGLFVKEIEHALLTKEIDMAVHSMKDMPAVLPEGLMIGCTPKRVDPRDAFISKSGASFKELAEGAILGTSSLRRSAQLLAARPDLQVKWIRGNIDTRLRKLKEEDYDAKTKEVLNRKQAVARPLSVTFTKLNQIIRGWINYFRIGNMKTFLEKYSEWMTQGKSDHYQTMEESKNDLCQSAEAEEDPQK